MGSKAAEAEVNPDLGFMGRLLALFSLPWTNPEQRIEYVRRNTDKQRQLTLLLVEWSCQGEYR